MAVGMAVADWQPFFFSSDMWFRPSKRPAGCRAVDYTLFFCAS